MSEQNKDREKNFSFFSHTACEYFPCHSGVDPGGFNCLFCYCPLYALGKECGGDFVFLKNGVKDCSGCTVPHRKENYGRITGQFQRILGLFQEK